MTAPSLSPAAILRRWDRIASAQLIEHAARLAIDHDNLRHELERTQFYLQCAERAAESWREDFMRACEESGARPGLTIDGRMVALTGESNE